MELKFRRLTADEIDCRVAMVSKEGKGLQLLLYKDARCDMNILDETVKPMNWKREHTRDNANCIVSIWDDEKQQWVSKEDTGTESNTEAAKGLASDSFKRACFNWGIGRELYSSPFIWITADKANIRAQGQKYVCGDKFTVTSINYDDKGNIAALAIRNDTRKCEAFSMGIKGSQARTKCEAKKKPEDIPTPQLAPLPVNHTLDECSLLAQRAGVDLMAVFAKKGINSPADITQEQLNKTYNWLAGKIG